MEVILAAACVLLFAFSGAKRKTKKLRERHERCRRLTYGKNPMLRQGCVISFHELAERSALIRSCCRNAQNIY